MSALQPHYGTVRTVSTDEVAAGSQGHHRRNTDATSRSRHSQAYSRSPVARRGDLGEYTEQDPFLPPRSRSSSPSATSNSSEQPRRRDKIATLWILPVVVMANLSRGMTMAPRIEVYTEIACEALHPASSPTPPSNFTAPPPLPLPLTLRDFQSVSPSSILDPAIPLNFLYDPHASNGLSGNKRAHAATPSEECLHDPAVQSRSAEIQATLGTIVGVLSIITAGYWGQISDAFGRTKALGANLFGMTFHDVIYILVSTPNSVFHKHAWAFLVLGPVVEGLLGGLTTLHAAQNAYLSDCAPSGSRSTIFAYYQGAIYISLAMGPQLAGLFLRATSTESKRPMFFIGLAFNIACLLYASIMLPETVTPEMMHHARQPSGLEGGKHDVHEKWGHRLRKLRHRLLSPLTMFGPKRRPGGGWDLNLTFLVIAQFTHLMSVGVVQVKFLYAQHTYAWSVKQLGYYISLLWTLRAFHLLLLLPTIVRFVKPAPPPSPNSTAQTLSQDLKFDYRIAQFSIFIDTLAYMLTLLAPASSQVLFVSFTSLSSFTAGVNPAIHSLAVSFLHSINSDANVGQMFGGMSMLQAVAHTIQPLLFGMVYSHTVASFPKAIFALAAALLLASVALLTLLRTNQTSRVDAEVVVEEEERENGRFGVGQAEDERNDRGRAESSRPLLGREDGSGR